LLLASWRQEYFPLPRHHLSDVQIRRAKPTPKLRKLFDGGGLFLLVHPNGSGYWRLKYRYGGRERLLALGVYPQVGLADARERAEEAKRLVASGVDPVHHRMPMKLIAAPIVREGLLLMEKRRLGGRYRTAAAS
jgi:hypothetical protein